MLNLRKLKSGLNQHPALYERVYNLVTRNSDFTRMRKEQRSYPSAFGGMWTDHVDYEDVLDAKLKTAEVKETDLPLIQQWREQGYITLPQAITHEAIDRYLNETDAMVASDDCPFLMTSAQAATPIPFTSQANKDHVGSRLVDDYMFSAASRDILFHDTILRYLEMFLEGQPLLTQTLRFNFGSEQALHQDTAFVRMNSPMKFIGVWIALEDIVPGSGELMYLPGSHTWEGFLFSGRFKHYDKDRDGEAQLAEWHQWILDEAKARGVKTETFAAKKGDVLFWHSGLAHGGSPVTNRDLTRKSLVAHYCKTGVRPLYHYYKPRQRKMYADNGRLYTTSYYR